MRKKIAEILKQIKGNWFEEETELITGGFISSFEVIKLVHHLENSFSINIPLERISLDSFNSIDGIIELICSLKNEV